MSAGPSQPVGVRGPGGLGEGGPRACSVGTSANQSPQQPRPRAGSSVAAVRGVQPGSDRRRPGGSRPRGVSRRVSAAPQGASGRSRPLLSVGARRSNAAHLWPLPAGPPNSSARKEAGPGVPQPTRPDRRRWRVPGRTVRPAAARLRVGDSRGLAPARCRGLTAPAPRAVRPPACFLFSFLHPPGHPACSSVLKGFWPLASAAALGCVWDWMRCFLWFVGSCLLTLVGGSSRPCQ